MLYFYLFLFLATALNSYFEFNEKSTNSYVFLEKTFPKLKSFTISTWLQIQNYEKKHIRKDIRTLFSYSIGFFFLLNLFKLKQNNEKFFLENFANILQCQISPVYKYSKNDNPNRVASRINVYISVLNDTCNFSVTHVYTNKSYWLHFTITWNALSKLDIN